MGCGGSKSAPEPELEPSSEDTRIDFLYASPLFHRVTPQDLVKVACAFKPVQYDAGDSILPGDVHNQMFLVVEGSYDLNGDIMKIGDCFGVHTPIEQDATNFHGKAVVTLNCLVLSRSDFAALGMKDHIGGSESAGVWSCRLGELSQIPPRQYVRLALSACPFVVKLYETYNMHDSLLFLLEACLGGDLYSVYEKHKQAEVALYGSHVHAKYYVASVVMALEHMHNTHILYRGIKPEDIVLDQWGYPKLCDMGFARLLVGSAWTMCGTPEYMAPEVILSKGYSFPIDWWGVGCLLFEWLAGCPTFYADRPIDIYEKIIKGMKAIHFPPPCKEAGVDSLISELCEIDPKKRLTSKDGGTGNIRNHEWYSGYDWDAHMSKSMAPPYQPPSDDANPLINYATTKTPKRKKIKYEDPGTGWDQDFATINKGVKCTFARKFTQSRWLTKSQVQGG